MADLQLAGRTRAAVTQH